MEREGRELLAEQRRQLRQDKAKPIIDGLYSWMLGQRQKRAGPARHQPCALRPGPASISGAVRHRLIERRMSGCGRGFNSVNGIELASGLMRPVGDPARAELVGLRVSRAGFRTFSAGVCSGRKALSYIGLAQGSTPPRPCRSSNRYARTPETLTSPHGPMLGR